MSTKITFQESSAASTPPTGYVSMYVKTDKVPYIKDDAGNETPLAAYSVRNIFVTIESTSTLPTGIMGFHPIDFPCEIQQVTVLTGETGSIVIDIWKGSYAAFPFTSANSITASAKPTISSARKYKDSTLTGWTTTVSEGDIFMYNIDSNSGIKKVVLAFKVLQS